MTTPANYTCNPGAWTQVSTGSATVTIKGPPLGYRVTVGTSAPGALSLGMDVVELDGLFSFSGLAAGTDNVYVTPNNGVAIGVVVFAS